MNKSITLIIISLFCFVWNGCGHQNQQNNLKSFKLNEHIRDTLYSRLYHEKVVRTAESEEYLRMEDTVIVSPEFSDSLIIITTINILPNPKLVIRLHNNNIEVIKGFREKPRIDLLEKSFTGVTKNDTASVISLINFMTFIDCFAISSSVVDSLDDFLNKDEELYNHRSLKSIVRAPKIYWTDSTTTVDFFIWHFHDYIDHANQKDSGVKQITVKNRKNMIQYSVNDFSDSH